MEGNYRPDQLGAKKWSELGKTVEIMLLMCDSIFGTFNSLVIDKDVSVAKGIIAL